GDRPGQALPRLPVADGAAAAADADAAGVAAGMAGGEEAQPAEEGRMTAMRALVTGSTGFLGRHLVERLRAQGWQVRALTRDPSRARIFTGTGTEVARGDLTSPESLTAALADVDVVFHSAALVTNWAPWK